MKEPLLPRPAVDHVPSTFNEIRVNLFSDDVDEWWAYRCLLREWDLELRHTMKKIVRVSFERFWEKSNRLASRLAPPSCVKRSFQTSLANNSPPPPHCRWRQMKTNRRVTGSGLIEWEADTTRMSAIVRNSYNYWIRSARSFAFAFTSICF